METTEYFDLNHAIRLAIKCHWRQIDKSGRPYIIHLTRVMNSFEEVDEEDEQIVAILHDCLEDGHFSWEDLLATGIRPDLADAINFLTRRGNEPYENHLQRCLMHPVSHKVKMADLQDHIDFADGVLSRTQLNKYLEALLFLKSKTGKDPNG